MAVDQRHVSAFRSNLVKDGRMPNFPASDNSLLVRTSFEDGDAWNRLANAVATETADGFRAYVETIDDPAWSGSEVDAIRDAIRFAGSNAAVGFIADDTALADDFPILVVHLDDADREPFRCIAAELWSVDNSLNIANMDWEDFAGALDVDGVFRGFA
jgi:hypothetical protein